MTSQNPEKFADLMTTLCIAYNREISGHLVKIYFDALADLDFGRVEKACMALIRESRFFPMPADIREAITGSVKDRSSRAWGCLYRALISTGEVPRNTPSDVRAAVEDIGGPDRMYALAFHDPNKAESTFRYAYEAILSRPAENHPMLTDGTMGMVPIP